MTRSARLSSAVIIAALLTLSLDGCIPVLAGGAATGGYVAGQERGVGTIASDTGIKASINNKWYHYNSDMASQLELSVYDGRVLITGTVANPDWKAEAVRLAWEADGVKEVSSEVQVADKSRITDAARDEWITTKLRSAILFDSDVRSVNYTIDVINGVIYLSGSARSQAELDKVVGYARNIANVKRVVNYVRIRPGDTSSTASSAPPRPAPPAPVVNGASATAPGYSGPTAQSAPPSNAPAGGYQTGGPASAPAGGSAPIEVTPLK